MNPVNYQIRLAAPLPGLPERSDAIGWNCNAHQQITGHNRRVTRRW